MLAGSVAPYHIGDSILIFSECHMLLPLDVVALCRAKPCMTQSAHNHASSFGSSLANKTGTSMAEHVRGKALSCASQPFLDTLRNVAGVEGVTEVGYPNSPSVFGRGRRKHWTIVGDVPKEPAGKFVGQGHMLKPALLALYWWESAARRKWCHPSRRSMT
jgi:hypothetical protein